MKNAILLTDHNIMFIFISDLICDVITKWCVPSRWSFMSIVVMHYQIGRVNSQSQPLLKCFMSPSSQWEHIKLTFLPLNLPVKWFLIRSHNKTLF